MAGLHVPEAVLEAARNGLEVTHAARALGATTLGLLSPVVCDTIPANTILSHISHSTLKVRAAHTLNAAPSVTTYRYHGEYPEAQRMQYNAHTQTQAQTPKTQTQTHSQHVHLRKPAAG